MVLQKIEPGVICLRPDQNVKFGKEDMHKITYYQLGNAETLRLDIKDNARQLLIDYADVRDPDDKDDLRCDLPKLLSDDLKKNSRDYYDAVAFTHLDDDHVRGSGIFFYFEHASTRQGNGRIKMNEMWVPAFAVTESNLEGDALVIRKLSLHGDGRGTIHWQQ